MKKIGPFTLLILPATSGFWFPDNIQENLRKGRKIHDSQPIKPCPNHQDFCEDIDDYPLESARLGEDLKEVDIVKRKLFETFPEERTSEPLPPPPPGNALRTSFVEESRACDHRKSTVYPKKARNVNGAFVFIKNDEEYKQAVEIEQCLGEGEPCRTESDISFGSTVCRQKYTTYKMFVINEKGDQVYDSFSLPSACLCFHKSDFAIRGGPSSLSSNSLDALLPTCHAAERLLIPAKKNKKNSSSGTEFKQTKKTKGNSFVILPKSEGEKEEIQPTLPVLEKAGSGESLISIFDKEEQDVDKIMLPQENEDSENIPIIHKGKENSSLDDKISKIKKKRKQNSPTKRKGDSAVQFGRRKKRQASVTSCYSTVCEEVEDYPELDIKATLVKSDVSSDLFQQLFNNLCDLRKRGFAIDEEQLCYGVPKIIFPKYAKNLREEWKYVVNIENYTQSVEIEECDDSSKLQNFGDDETSLKSLEDDGNDFGVCLYSGSEGNDPDLTVCRQLFTEHKLLALSNENQLEVDSFKLPSACACFVRQDYILEFRKGDMEGKTELPLPPQVEEGPSNKVVFEGGR